MKKILLIVSTLIASFQSASACYHLEKTSQPLPTVVARDAATDKTQNLTTEYKDQIKLFAFGNLSDASFIADIKALNKLEKVDKLQRIVVIMDTKDIEVIRKFITENEIKIRMVIPSQEGWQKDWKRVTNRAVYIADQKNIVSYGVDVIGNEKLIQETAAKLIPGTS
jgi:hypothetical protein